MVQITNKKYRSLAIASQNNNAAGHRPRVRPPRRRVSCGAVLSQQRHGAVISRSLSGSLRRCLAILEL
jgi:hypothetical protein